VWIVDQGNVPANQSSSTFPERFASVPHVHDTVYVAHHLRYSQPFGKTIVAAVGGVESITNVCPVKMLEFPARSVAMILITALELSVGNVRENDPSLSVPVVIVAYIELNPLFESSMTILFGDRFASVPVFRVMMCVVHHSKKLLLFGDMKLMPEGAILSIIKFTPVVFPALSVTTKT
jgi:hypothetical protein